MVKTTKEHSLVPDVFWFFFFFLNPNIDFERFLLKDSNFSVTT